MSKPQRRQNRTRQHQMSSVLNIPAGREFKKINKNSCTFSENVLKYSHGKHKFSYWDQY